MALPNIRTEVRFISHHTQMVLFHRELGMKMLKAAGSVIRDAAEEEARQGMKGGAFVGQSTGRVSQYGVHDVLHENIRMKVINRPLNPIVEVGTHVPHGSFWETGHTNLFLKKFVKNQWLTRAAHRNIAEAADAARKEAASFARKQSRKKFGITRLRTILYNTSKLMGHINAVVGIPGLRGVRSNALLTARVLGDVSAVGRGAGGIAGRVSRRYVGRSIGQGGLRRISTGSYQVPRRVMRSIAGQHLGGHWDRLVARDAYGRVTR